MKKLFAVLILTTLMTACNSNTTGSETKTDSAAAPVSEAAQAGDTTKKTGGIAEELKDSAKALINEAKDTLKAKALDAGKDVIKKASEAIKK